MHAKATIAPPTAREVLTAALESLDSDPYLSRRLWSEVFLGAPHHVSVELCDVGDPNMGLLIETHRPPIDQEKESHGHMSVTLPEFLAILRAMEQIGVQLAEDGYIGTDLVGARRGDGAANGSQS